MNFAGRRFFVTGADGFIGSHLVERLVREGASVTALALYNSHGTAGWLDSIDRSVRGDVSIVYGDIRDQGFMRDAMSDTEYCFHLAALISIPHSYEAPQSYIDTNVHGTLNVLQAARAAGTRRVVVTSTSEVYGTPDTVPITESHPLRAQSPYAASKIGADQLALSFAASFGLAVTILRPFNTYGPRQSTRAVIMTVLSQMMSGSDEIRVGSLTPQRDFTYVSDTVEGFIRCVAADLEPGAVVQLGTGVAVSVADLIAMCRRVTGSEAQIVSDQDRVRPDDSEVMVLLADPSNAAKRINWKPTVGLQAGLQETVEWLRQVDYQPDVENRYR